jgi:hypothetical protein
MKIDQLPRLKTRGNDLYLDGDHTAEQLAVARSVGYRNYFRVGCFEAADMISRDCPAGWRGAVAVMTSEMPNGSVRVGQVKVHHGDPEYGLFVCPR